jgi:hypothetical protein
VPTTIGQDAGEDAGLFVDRLEGTIAGVLGALADGKDDWIACAILAVDDDTPLNRKS